MVYFQISITKKRTDAYVSILDGELHVVSSLQSLQVTLELAVVEENLLHHVGSLDEAESLLNEDTQTVQRQRSVKLKQ